MAEPTRVDLGGALAGRHVLIDTDLLTFGVIEDLASGQIGGLLDGLAGIIIGGDLPGGVDRKGLRNLKLAEGQALIQGVTAVVAVPKSD